MNEADEAHKITELNMAISLSNLSTEKLETTGQCHNCFEHLYEQVPFCDADCRDDYEQRKRFKGS